MNKLWETFLPGVPMPPGATYQEFCAAREGIWREEDIKLENQMLEELQELQSHTGEFLAPDERQQFIESYQFLIDATSERLAGLMNYV